MGIDLSAFLDAIVDVRKHIIYKFDSCVKKHHKIKIPDEILRCVICIHELQYRI
jgi:hypothetical protein